MTPEPETKGPHRIVLYVDDSERWHAAAALLGRFVKVHGGHVTVACSLLLKGRRERSMAEAVKLLALPPEQVSTVTKLGIAERTIPKVARETGSDAIVLGHLSRGGWLANGLSATIIARRAEATTLLARRMPSAIERILVCTEGSAQGEACFARAAVLAKTFDAKLDVLHVANVMGLTDEGERDVEQDLRDFVSSDAPEAEHLRALRARLVGAGLRGEVLVRAGLVVDEVTATAREGNYDLLVIGAHDAAPGADVYEDFASLILRGSPISTLVLRRSRPMP